MSRVYRELTYEEQNIFLSDEQKSKESREIGQSILKEMMEIVSKRDALVALLDEDRLRCFLNKYPNHASHFSTTFSCDEPHFSFIACFLFVFAFALLFFGIHILLTEAVCLMHFSP